MDGRRALIGGLDLSTWVGRERRITEVIEPSSAHRLGAVFDRPTRREMLPEGWHWATFLDAAPQSRLGEDGHPARGGLLPPVPLPRRMFAGSEIDFRAPIRIGLAAELTETVTAVETKTGRSGPLVFVTVQRVVAQGDAVCLSERQSLVYREGGKPGPAAIAPVIQRPPADWRQVIWPDAVLLFRFSAATFNSHRIHYDLPYATQAEGYPGLVVQGPLIALSLLEAAREAAAGHDITGFSFRAVRPLFSPSPFTVCGAWTDGGARLWAEDVDGHEAMTAQVTLRPKSS